MKDHKPGCASRLSCTMMHSDGECPGYPCNCGFSAPPAVPSIEDFKQKKAQESHYRGDAFRFVESVFDGDSVGFTEEDGRVVIVANWEDLEGVSYTVADARRLAYALLLAAVEAEEFSQVAQK